MSIEAMTWVLTSKVGDAQSKLVLWAIANHAHRDGRNAWAAKETLADYAECSTKTVQRHIRDLRAGGWIRLGDQQQVAHIRGDRRPRVYDLAMTEARRLEWAAEARGDNLSPRDRETTGQVVPSSEPHGGTQPCPPRGDTALSPNPFLNQDLPPLPPTAAASGGDVDEQQLTRCARPGPTPHTNCRGCGTTNRQLAETERRRRADAARNAAQIAAAAERAARASTRVPTEDRPASTTAAVEAARRTVRSVAGSGRAS